MNGSTHAQPSTTIATTESNDKLSGQLIIKAQLGDDIRKMMIHNEDLTLNELVLMMERIFAGKISNSDELTIKYLDGDGDKITLLNDSDLTVALHFHKVLRLFVLVNGSEQPATNTTQESKKDGSLIDARIFRTELQQIRNSVQTILDRLQISTSHEEAVVSEKEKVAPKEPTPAVVTSTTREFDPYKHLQQTQRSTTPDSVRSRSSNSNKITPPVQTVDNQNQYQMSEANEANKSAPPLSNAFQQTPMPTPYFVPAVSNDQQAKGGSSAFGVPPPTFAAMPPLPNAGPPRFASAFPPSTSPNTITTPSFVSSSAPPLANPPPTQTSAFIGQQTPVAPPPSQAGGFYNQQQTFMPQRFPTSGFNPNISTQNAFAQPPSASSPATITPSFVPPTAMPAPPPLASQQPYGGYQPQTNYFNPNQQYQKTQ